MANTTRRARWPALAIVAAPLVAALIVAPTAHAAATATPQLSIAIDNGQSAAKVGDTLTYRIVVTNLGPDRVQKLRVTQSLPPGLTARKADSGGVVGSADVSWVVTLKAAEKTTLTTSATVSKTSRQTLRLASVACASIGTKAPPIVCASHSDQLAAGARADAASARATEKGSTSGRFVWIAGGIVVVALALALVMWRRRRRVSDEGQRRGA